MDCPACGMSPVVDNLDYVDVADVMQRLRDLRQLIAGEVEPS